MDIKTFAEKHRVKIQRDSCNDQIIAGKQFFKDMPHWERTEYRSHVFDYEDGEHFGVCLMFAPPKKWGNARRKLEAAGFAIRQNGDTEGIGLFDPKNSQQAKLALKVAGVKTRRALTPERRQAMSEILAQARVRRAQNSVQTPV